jgi:iron complex outermembrane receptor protein
MTALSVALAMAALPSAAWAQSTGPSTNVPSTPDPEATQTPGQPTAQDQERADLPGDPDPEIVVTGFRAAVANAIAEKRRSDQILESISSEDIGKLPDNSIAESIARLPGLTAQRVEGRDQVISIRGFAPDFATTLLNGREQVTTGDNRAVEFDQYPSELLGQVVVYKTPSAGLIGQGISGTIDLRTVRPLQYGKPVLAASARGEIVTKGKLNAGSTDKGYRVSGTFIDQFADNTLGVTIGIAHSNSPSQFERFNAWGYPTFDCGARAEYQVAGGGACNSAFAAAEGKLIIGGAKPFVQSNELTRTGVIGTVEWEPTEALTLTLDALYTDFKEEQSLRGIELPFYWGNATLQPGFEVTGNTITAGTWNNVKGVVRNDYVERNAEIISGGLNAKHENDGWTLVGDASYSRVKRDDIYIETYSGTSRYSENGPYDTMDFDTQNNGITTFTSRLNYADRELIKLTSPQGWANGPRPGSVPGGQDGFLSAPRVEDELYAFRVSALRDLGEGTTFEIGANYTARHKEYVPTALFLATQANIDDPTKSTSVRVPDQYYLGTTNLSYLGIPGQVSFDPVGLVRDGILVTLVAANEPTAFNTWTLQENVTTGWLRGGWDTPAGARGTFSGNAGVQVVYTDQSSESFANLTGTPTPNNQGRKYVHILPSINLSMRFDDANVLRVGIARTLARARMDQLKASINYGTNPALATSTNPFSSFYSAGGGNPRLKPWVADGLDVSFEHYFNRNAYFALAGFYKYLETYIYDSKVIFDFAGAPSGGVTPATTLGVITQPVNGSGGKLYGGEASATIPLSLFTEALDGFGLIGSYSYTDSSIKANPGNPSQPLPGLSKHVANATAFFEKYGFSARVSARYRSKFLAEVISLGPGARNRLARAETIVDAQIGYEFQGGPLQGLGILLQGQNLTAEPFVTEDSGNGLVIDNQDYGRRFLAGVSYKF